MGEQQKKKEFGFGRFSSYRNYIGYVVAYAPSEFPKEDWEEERTTLDKAFDILRRGLPVSFDRIKDKGAISDVELMLEASLIAYKRGDVKAGAHLLQDFDSKLLNLRRGRSKKNAL